MTILEFLTILWFMTILWFTTIIEIGDVLPWIFSALSLAGWRIIPQISATGNTPLDFRGSRFSDIEPRSQWLVCCYATALFAGIPIAKVDIHK